MREWKAQGRFRYLGVTHYEAGAFAEVAKNPRARETRFRSDQLLDHGTEAEEKILPLAQDRVRSRDSEIVRLARRSVSSRARKAVARFRSGI